VIPQTLPGNPHEVHSVNPDTASTADGRVISAALLALAYEQRTANLIAMLSLPQSPPGTVWQEWHAEMHAQLSGRLGIEL
jgi:hypothetical protein